MLHYNNIACTMCMLSSKSKLVHMVSLGSTRDKNSHHEYEVIKGGEKSISLRLEFYPTLVLKYNDGIVYVDITIRDSDLYRFTQAVNECSKWFDGTEQVFEISKEGSVIIPSYRQIKPIVVRDLLNGMWLAFEPAIVGTNDKLDSYTPGLRLYLNSQTTSDLITIDRYYALFSKLRGFNLYSASLPLVTYANTATPGTNLVKMYGEHEDFNATVENESGTISGGPTGRKVPGKKTFFDR